MGEKAVGTQAEGRVCEEPPCPESKPGLRRSNKSGMPSSVRLGRPLETRLRGALQVTAKRSYFILR